MSDLKSDRMLDALERLEAVKADLRHDRSDIGYHLHLAVEALKDALAQQLLMERRRETRPKFDAASGETALRPVEPVVLKGYNDPTPLGGGGHPPADRGGSEAGCYS